MKKYPIGFNTKIEEEHREIICADKTKPNNCKKCVVQVYFPLRGLNLTYYNDSFDLKIGDIVYVEGKLEGIKGRVTDISYSFKIKVNDYKKVIGVVDTNITGDFYFAGSHLISFDKKSMPYSKVKSWFVAPDDAEYVVSSDGEDGFLLDDLSQMNISPYIADKGFEYYMENRVVYISLDKNRGYAIVMGSETYEVEFDYTNGEITNLVCTCFCSYTCKHQYAAMLQLKNLLEIIEEKHTDKYNDYFAAICKNEFVNIVISNNDVEKISI